MTVLPVQRAPRAKELGWNPCYRLIPSRFPPTSLFDRVARPQELDAVFAIQALTNPRLRDEIGQIHMVPADERVSGEGSTPVMAAFCHLNPEGSRFSDGTWGVYYGAESLETAVAEVSHHRSRFLAATQEPALQVDMRAYGARVMQPLHDLRGKAWQSLHQHDDYAAPQQWARRLREAQSWGVAYRSVRRPGGECVAVFRPRALALPVVQCAHVALHWDGQRMASWCIKSDPQTL
ncbi:RES family NAD+ phosphorylase [Ideonella sp.]|jgi:hypothetical protein|uniref:RES family NAD+ phosphorylase n=1 Tax=Ideonella sp. TaxID=1929293 RepID=UPI0037C1099A